MNIENLIESIYEHAGLSKPKEILFFSSMTEAFADYKNWSRRVEKVMTCFWSYQFPMAIPSSYWALYHLKKDNFRLDVRRSPNENGCFVYGEYLNKDLTATLTQSVYEKICTELAHHKYDLTVDKMVKRVREKYWAEIKLFDECMFKEDDTCQIGVEDFIFLGNFEWVQKEYWFLTYCKNEYGIPINEPMLKILKEIGVSKKLFLTFSNMVIVLEDPLLTGICEEDLSDVV